MEPSEGVNGHECAQRSSPQRAASAYDGTGRSTLVLYGRELGQSALHSTAAAATVPRADHSRVEFRGKAIQARHANVQGAQSKRIANSTVYTQGTDGNHYDGPFHHRSCVAATTLPTCTTSAPVRSNPSQQCTQRPMCGPGLCRPNQSRLKAHSAVPDAASHHTVV
jgi:hypothetical protein